MTDKIRVRLASPEKGKFKTFSVPCPPDWLLTEWEEISRSTPPYEGMGARLRRFFEALLVRRGRHPTYAGDPGAISSDYWRGKTHLLRSEGRDYACPCNAGQPCVRPGA